MRGLTGHGQLSLTPVQCRPRPRPPSLNSPLPPGFSFLHLPSVALSHSTVHDPWPIATTTSLRASTPGSGTTTTSMKSESRLPPAGTRHRPRLFTTIPSPFRWNPSGMLEHIRALVLFGSASPSQLAVLACAFAIAPSLSVVDRGMHVASAAAWIRAPPPPPLGARAKVATEIHRFTRWTERSNASSFR